MYCSTCNVESGPTLFCHVCDNYLPTAFTGLKSGLVRRLVAVIVDDVLAFTILILSFRWLLSVGEAPSGNASVIVLVSCFAVIAYGIAFISALSHGATPGKWILGIRAIDKRNGQAPGLGRMLVRELIGKPVSGFFAGLGFFWAIWDRDSQAWHDKLAGTVVVQKDASSTDQPSTLRPAAACIAFVAILGLQIYSIVNPSGIAVKEKRIQARTAEPLPSEDGPIRSAAEPGTSTISDAAEAAPTIRYGASTDKPTSEITSSDQQQDAVVKAQISAMLTHWASATEANDPTTAASYYAETVNRYFLARNVTRTYVLQDKEASHEKGLRFVSYQIEQLNFDNVSSDSANVSIVKSYEFTDSGTEAPTNREVRSRLWLQNIDGEWKIVGEQDLLK